MEPHTHDPAVLVVPPRVVRRVIKADRSVRTLGLAVPHDACYALPRARLLPHVHPSELPVPIDALPDEVVLVAALPAADLEEIPAAHALVEVWRRVFHARVDRALQRAAESGELTPAGVAERIDRVGQIPFDEARYVLRQEDRLLPPGGDLDAWIEFVALVLELRFFAPDRRSTFFPGIDDFDRVDAIVAEDVDAAGLFELSRPPGAADPIEVERAREAALAGVATGDAGPVEDDEDEGVTPERLEARARAARRKGNDVRAATLYLRAQRLAGGGDYRERARQAVASLAARLAVCFAPEGPGAARWEGALVPLAEAADGRRFDQATKLLVDLQSLCVDIERELFDLNLVGWALSLGRRPLKRNLPTDKLARAIRSLDGAARRARKVRAGEEVRRAVLQVLHGAHHTAESRLRKVVEPIVHGGLDEVGLVPDNLPEAVARDKVAAELVDKIIDQGFIGLSHVRDALSRNDLKLPDLRGPVELLRGDPLLKLDRFLARRLGGVYRRGEIYMRALQRVSSLFFGTSIGQLLTLYLLLPFGGAYVLLEGVQHVIFPLVGLLVGADLHHVHLVSRWSLLGLGLALLGLLHSPAVRAGAAAVGRGLKKTGRFVFVEVPVAIIGWPPLVEVWRSPLMRRLRRYVLKPLLLSAVVWWVVPTAGADAAVSVAFAAGSFLLMNVLLNSRTGRLVEEVVTDAAARSWDQLRYRVLPGLVRLVLDFFTWALTLFERGLYTVDEWLRFRGGESRFTFVIKALASIVWSAVTYVVRIYVNLLIEPQVNPIKHFPVVTVAHKVMLPMLPEVTGALVGVLVPVLGPVVGTGVAGFTVFVLPGFAGFLVWEFKENWRLYRANRAEALKPSVIGHHSETMLRLMKPGFHSGTLPKAYARLRHSHRSLRPGAARRARHTLHEVEHAVTLFVERELVAVLDRARGWDGGPLRVARVTLGANSVRVAVAAPDLGSTPMALAFEEQSGWLVAGVAARGWLDGLSEGSRAALEAALLGLYERAGVDIVRAQVRRVVAGDAPFDVADEGLVVWPEPGYRATVTIPLKVKARGLSVPREPDGRPAEGRPAVDLDRVLLSRVPLRWTDWVAAWERDAEGGSPRDGLMEPLHAALPADVRPRARLPAA